MTEIQQRLFEKYGVDGNDYLFAFTVTFADDE